MYQSITMLIPDLAGETEGQKGDRITPRSQSRPPLCSYIKAAFAIKKNAFNIHLLNTCCMLYAAGTVKCKSRVINRQPGIPVAGRVSSV